MLRLLDPDKGWSLQNTQATEFALLQVLALHPRKLFTHEALLKRVWGPEYSSEAEYLRVYIGRLRRKLEPDPAKPVHILTEPGIGYYMVN
jgi:DNA-binding response OmpR family regulator